ncbi:hypothetical protein D3C71_1744710 [compost metagenome]
MSVYIGRSDADGLEQASSGVHLRVNFSHCVIGRIIVLGPHGRILTVFARKLRSENLNGGEEDHSGNTIVDSEIEYIFGSQYRETQSCMAILRNDIIGRSQMNHGVAGEH